MRLRERHLSRKTGVRIAVDIGGTFTDFARGKGASLDNAKILTTRQDPVRNRADLANRLERKR